MLFLRDKLTRPVQSLLFFGRLSPRSSTTLTEARDITIRTMRRGDFPTLFEWVKKEGWNPGIHDFKALYATDPLGYRLLSLGKLPVASLAAVKYSTHFGFLGLYFVTPGWRNAGYGKLLWDVSIHTLQDCDCIGLNAVMRQQSVYAKGGFEFYNLNTRWISTLENPMLEKLASEKTIFSITKQVPLQSIADYDARAFSVRRDNFWKKMLSSPQTIFLGAMDGDILKGFACLSTYQDETGKIGWKIAPLYADNEQIARNLLGALYKTWTIQYKNTGKTTPLQLDTPDTNPAVAALVGQLGFLKVFDTARMYKGKKPDMEEDKIFGLTSLEIG